MQYRPAWTVAIAVLVGSACGIREHRHSRPQPGSAYDFIPKESGRHDAAVEADGGAADAEPATPEAPALVLGGVSVPKADVLAFIHFGHSNMAGRAHAPPELLPYFMTETHPRVWMYSVGSPPVLATEPTAYDGMERAAGPAVALLKQAAELAPDKYFLSLGFAHGGATCVQFTPGQPYAEEITKSALAIKDRVTFAAIVVMLGVIEGQKRGGPETLPDCFVKLASAVREAVGRPDLPLLFSGYEVEATGRYAVDQERPQQVVAALAEVPGLVPHSALVPADGLAMQDDHHFDLTGHKLWTKRLLDIMQAKGWFPWGTNHE
jgi:hypothetical protein